MGTRLLLGTVVPALLIGFVVAAAWRTDGGRWESVRTASMGTAAPVGTLLLTRQTTVADIEVGDIITFRAPGSRLVYSHRVVARTGDGLTTKGDINPVPDAWTVHQGDLVGKVVYLVPGLGWALRGLPLMFACLAAVWLVSSLLRRSRRQQLRLMGVSLSLGVVGLVYHPWVALQQIGVRSAVDGGVLLRIVSTGLLPVKIYPLKTPHDSMPMVNGRVADLAVHHADKHGHYAVGASLDLSPAWWVALIVVSLLPLLWTLVVGFDPVEVEFSDPYADEDEEPVPDGSVRPARRPELVPA